MEKLLAILKHRGYNVTNGRVLGDPKASSEETRHKDLVQELALIVDWLRSVYGIDVSVKFVKGIEKTPRWVFMVRDMDAYSTGIDVKYSEEEFSSPEKALMEGIKYVISLA